MSAGEGGGVTAADWAVRSKHPGRAMGYMLLACSGDGRRSDRLIEAGVTGTPSDENANMIDALPWWSFVSDGSGASPVLGVLVRSWSDERDATGQTIVSSRLLTVPWPRSTAMCPGFLGLYSRSQSVEWTGVDRPPRGAVDGVPMSLSVSPLDVGLLAETIDEVGFDWMLAVTVALLDGEQVVILTPGRNLPTKERVRLLDAVCALLPYGCRSWISAATWARDRTEHAVRLSFAASARPNQHAISFTNEQPPVTGRTPAAAAYHQEMQILRAKGMTTAAIVAHLAVMYEPLGQDHAELAVKHLQELRLPEAVYEEICTGWGDPARVDQVLSRSGWGGLTVPIQQGYAFFLADAAQTADTRGAFALETLKRRWALAPVHHLADSVVQELSTGQHGPGSRRVDTACKIGEQARDDLIAAVLQRVASADAALARRTVDLLIETKSLSPKNPPAWQVLAGNSELGSLLLRKIGDLDRKGEHFAKMLEVLRPYEGVPGAEWLRPVQILFYDGRVDASVDGLADCVLRLLFDLAVARRQVGAFVAVAWQYVLQLAFWPSQIKSFPNLKSLAQHVAADPPPSGSAEAIATADLLSLGTDGTMPHLAQSSPPDLTPLAAAWRVLPGSAQTALAARLPAAVLGGELTQHSFYKLMQVTDTLDPERLREPAAAEVGRYLISRPEILPALAFNEKWTRDLVQYAPQYSWLLEFFPLNDRAKNPHVDPSVLRDGYRQFRERGAPARTAVLAIAPWLHANGPVGLTRLLRSFVEAMGGSSHERIREIHAAAFDEATFPGLGQGFQQHVAEQRQFHETELQTYKVLDQLNDDVLARQGKRRYVDPRGVTQPVPLDLESAPEDSSRLAAVTGGLKRAASLFTSRRDHHG